MAEKRVFKTTRKLTINKTYRAWDNYEVGDVVIGKIIGSHYSEKSKKFGPIIEVYDAQFKKEKPETYYKKNLVLNPAGKFLKDLAILGFDGATGKMGDSEGVVIQVEYTGKGEMGNGPYKGKEAHSMITTQVEEDLPEEDEVEL